MNKSYVHMHAFANCQLLHCDPQSLFNKSKCILRCITFSAPFGVCLCPYLPTLAFCAMFLCTPFFHASCWIIVFIKLCLNYLHFCIILYFMLYVLISILFLCSIEIASVDFLTWKFFQLTLMIKRDVESTYVRDFFIIWVERKVIQRLYQWEEGKKWLLREKRERFTLSNLPLSFHLISTAFKKGVRIMRSIRTSCVFV